MGIGVLSFIVGFGFSLSLITEQFISCYVRVQLHIYMHQFFVRLLLVVN